MKIKDLARMHNIPIEYFNDFLNTDTKYDITETVFGGKQVADHQTEGFVIDVKAHMNNFIEQQEALEKAEKIEEKKKSQAMAEMLITSGFNFDGYSVIKYSGYISGDDAVEVDRGQQGIFSTATHVGDALMGGLTEIRRNALIELKEQAYALGCNAIIGVDFDYLTLEPETVSASGGTLYMPYVFGVTANGNAVIIEKNM